MFSEGIFLRNITKEKPKRLFSLTFVKTTFVIFKWSLFVPHRAKVCMFTGIGSETEELL